MFVHGLKSSNPERTLSPFFDAVALPIINKLQIHYQDILRVKINLTTQHEKSFVSEFHVDCNKPHQVAIYYLNTNNGFTELEDGTKINSIGNRLVVLNNGEKHRSISSTDKIRIVLNINWHEK